MPRFTPFALVACTLIAALAAATTPARADEPKVYLTWGAPYGQPGARDQVQVTNDSTRVDTLYLSFDPNDFAPAFVGLTAGLYFSAQAGDSLGPFWSFARDGVNPGSLRVDFDVTPYQAISPWKSTGMGFPKYERLAGGGRLTFIYAVPSDAGVPLQAGKVYALGRVYISHRRATLAGHTQPTCIEWRDADFSLSPETSAQTKGAGKSTTAWNSPDGKACAGRGVQSSAAPADSASGKAKPPAKPVKGSRKTS